MRDGSVQVRLSDDEIKTSTDFALRSELWQYPPHHSGLVDRRHQALAPG